jgi:hypothetical protein
MPIIKYVWRPGRKSVRGGVDVAGGLEQHGGRVVQVADDQPYLVWLRSLVMPFFEQVKTRSREVTCLLSQERRPYFLAWAHVGS